MQHFVLKAMIVKRSGNGTLEGLGREGDTCHYLHQGADTMAALNLCDEEDVHGIVIKNKKTYEVMPLTSRLKRMLDVWKSDNNGTE